MPDTPPAPRGSFRGFRRLPREHERLDALDLYARVVQKTGDPIGERFRIDRAISQIRDNVVKVVETPSTLHGWRVQALFEAVVASIGRVRLLKAEDAGDVFFDGEQLRVPDFRIVTADGEQLLVEVKNYYHNDPTRPFQFARSS